MIQFNQISKQYQMGQQQVAALNQVSGEIKQGEMVALCGPSGSGKSTLLNILGLLDMDYQGEISLSGNAYPKDPKQAALLRRTQLGFVFQKFNLVPVMTAWENVAYPLMLNGYSVQEQKRMASELLEHVGLAEFKDHRPDNLSGGQQQRVAIARALVHKPQLVIADEPTASLDSRTAGIVIDLMKNLGHQMGTTFVVATHDSRMALHCDRSIDLVDGRINEEAIKWAS
ncbi:lipoprotein-releasing system ATP-binding protein LolD [Vibrio orientalis CIP 102891 = ATCC 33934]|uniref:ABC transporter ATP-binding protein n=1 Tax=Vibrio orientalis CIP 102891 = ATCC 33934 TaxID=675816 RepID=C9QE82_VIBOR|nr:ABC transporter ATP-binding protein [Vibrio orientalis]EEX94267.1 ABC transporter ATP-binding protein [Vibrio orientalis CIP 102891 = ATCC 33934]EGU54188.1 lipoprotein-releasing system ATP-binding protein LolD [Vibrio orientalis CIP 102891 = ATCC 33934]